MTEDKGLIYILTNPSFPNYQKIGKTTDLKGRLRSLNDKSCLPFSFRVYATYQIDSNLSVVEAEIFKIIDSVDDTLRAREESERGGLRQREFFAIDKEKAFSVLQSIAKLRGDTHKLKLITPTQKEVEEEVIAEEVEDAVKYVHKDFDEKYAGADRNIQELYDKIRDYILSLSNDVSVNKTKRYEAFRKTQHFVCAKLRLSKIILSVKLDVNSVKYETGFSRDTSNIGHWGMGDVEVTIKNEADFEKAKALIERAYEEN